MKVFERDLRMQNTNPSRGEVTYLTFTFSFCFLHCITVKSNFKDFACFVPLILYCTSDEERMNEVGKDDSLSKYISFS